MSVTGGSKSARRPGGRRGNEDKVRDRSAAAREKARQALLEARIRKTRRQRLTVAVASIAIFLAAIVGMVVVKYVEDHGDSGVAAGADDSIGNEIAALAKGVPDSVFDQIGKGKVYSRLDKAGADAGARYPVAVTGQPQLLADGKPLVLYFGSELCPHCSTQRWPVLVALSRFGTFSGLRLTFPPNGDTDPDKRILTFHDATFTSDHLAFRGAELVLNTGGGRTERAKLSPEDEKVLATLNVEPYVEQGAEGGVPFMVFANKYIIQGGTYDGSTIDGKTAEGIAKSLSDPKGEIAAGVDGSANMISALLCELTQGKPENVCSSAGVKVYADAL